MNDTNTNRTTCQDPNISNFVTSPQLIEDIALTEPAPTWTKVMAALGLEQNENNCKAPDVCGKVRVYEHDEDRWEHGHFYQCNWHSCPSSRIRNVYPYLGALHAWAAYYWFEIADGPAFQTLRDWLADSGLPYLGFPTDHGTVIMLVPEALRDAVPYTGGWYHLNWLYLQIPEGARLRRPRAKVAAIMKSIGVIAGSDEPAAQKSDLPLVARYNSYLVNWTVEDEVYYLLKHGFRVGVGRRGGIAIFFRDQIESERIEDALCEMAHNKSVLLRQTHEEMTQQNRLQPDAPWVRLAVDIKNATQEYHQYRQ